MRVPALREQQERASAGNAESAACHRLPTFSSNDMPHMDLKEMHTKRKRH